MTCRCKWGLFSIPGFKMVVIKITIVRRRKISFTESISISIWQKKSNNRPAGLVQMVQKGMAVRRCPSKSTVRSNCHNCQSGLFLFCPYLFLTSSMQLTLFFHRIFSFSQSRPNLCAAPFRSIHDLSNKSHLCVLWMPWRTSRPTLDEKHCDGLFLELSCFRSFHSARVGLLCSHVWLGHFTGSH